MFLVCPIFNYAHKHACKVTAKKQPFSIYNIYNNPKSTNGHRVVTTKLHVTNKKLS